MANCDIQALLDDASCFETLLAGQKQTVLLQLLCDIRGQLEGGSGAGVLVFTTGAAPAASGVISAVPADLLTLSFTNGNVATRYLQLFNSITVPADATVPFFSAPVLAGATLMLNFGPLGIPFSTGIAWSNSTTAATKTIGAADSIVLATYR